MDWSYIGFVIPFILLIYLITKLIKLHKHPTHMQKGDNEEDGTKNQKD